MKKLFFYSVSLSMMIASSLIPLFSLSVNQQLSKLTIRDANNNPATIPDFGSKVLTIFYNDTEASDIGDPLVDALKAKGFSKAKCRGIGIANLKDSIAPNWLIRKIIEGKIKKYNQTILTDVELTVPSMWSLGNCNNKSVCIIIGKDTKVKYIKYMDKNNPPTQVDIDNAVNIVSDLVK